MPYMWLLPLYVLMSPNERGKTLFPFWSWNSAPTVSVISLQWAEADSPVAAGARPHRLSLPSWPQVGEAAPETAARECRYISSKSVTIYG